MDTLEKKREKRKEQRIQKSCYHNSKKKIANTIGCYHNSKNHEILKMKSRNKKHIQKFHKDLYINAGHSMRSKMCLASIPSHSGRTKTCRTLILKQTGILHRIPLEPLRCCCWMDKQKHENNKIILSQNILGKQLLNFQYCCTTSLKTNPKC